MLGKWMLGFYRTVQNYDQRNKSCILSWKGDTWVKHLPYDQYKDKNLVP
jgi:hypothetical protein